MSAEREVLLEVKDLKMYFPILRGLFQRKVGEIKAVDGVSFSLRRGQTLGLVGETGCGKTTIGRCVLRLYTPTSGQILFEGREISKLPEKEMRSIRRRIGVVFQDPYSSLNPRETAGSIVADPIKVHNVTNRNELKERVERLFELVGLDPSMADRVPHEFSGGQRQRLAIARALATEPSLIVLDEPVSALDVSIQAQIINLLEDLQRQLNLTYLFIAHDLSVVQHISDRVAVMYLGRIIELAGSEELFSDPLHPYTQALLSAVPIPDPLLEKKRQRIVLRGEVPSPANPPPGCHFHPRCTKAREECRRERPELKEVRKDHFVACFRAEEG